MSDGLLTILKLFFLALLYLFFFRVLRAVWAELTAPAVTAAPAGPAGAGGRAAAVRGGARTPMRLKVVEPASDRGRTYDLGDELTAGRASGCQISLPDDTFVSQLHARIFRRDGQIYVEDLGSTNGTFLNRKKVSSPQPLRRGDRLQIGKTVLELAK
jgi:pSer/pThr/pTyr-binding forkhead associated (FHA) protein